jgi:hypothetical protein
MKGEKWGVRIVTMKRGTRGTSCHDDTAVFRKRKKDFGQPIFTIFMILANLSTDLDF